MDSDLRLMPSPLVVHEYLPFHGEKSALQTVSIPLTEDRLTEEDSH